jgi:Domain of unknown function (DUF4411)
MAYLIDSSVFIDASRRYYSFDLVPRFWQWLIEANEAGDVFSAHHMKGELLAGQDALGDWADNRGSEFFLPEDAAVVASIGQVSAWAQQQVADGRYRQAAVNTFTAGDVYLVGTALAFGHTVVTLELPDPNGSMREIKMPEACAALGIPWCGPFLMLAQLGVQLGA